MRPTSLTCNNQRLALGATIVSITTTTTAIEVTFECTVRLSPMDMRIVKALPNPLASQYLRDKHRINLKDGLDIVHKIKQEND